MIVRWYEEGFDARADGVRPRWRSYFAWWVLRLPVLLRDEYDALLWRKAMIEAERKSADLG